jgi:ParB family transcriptional regulator, chromosome partitioning protein
MEIQMSLLPQTRPTPIQQWIELSKLPSDHALIGPDPDAAFIRSVKDFGILQSVVIAEKDGHYRVLAGRRRVKAARAACLTMIPALVYPDDWTVDGVITLVENQQRKRNPAADVQAVKELIRQGHSERDIAKQLGLPIITLKGILRLSGLHPELLLAFAEGKVKEGVAEAASKLPASKQKELAVVLVKTGKLRHEDVTASIKASPVVLPGELFSTPSSPVVTATQPICWRERIKLILQDAIPDARPEDWAVLAAIQELLGK